MNIPFLDQQLFKEAMLSGFFLNYISYLNTAEEQSIETKKILGVHQLPIPTSESIYLLIEQEINFKVFHLISIKTLIFYSII